MNSRSFLRPPKHRLAQPFGQVDLADQLAVGSVAAHAVLGGIAPAHAAPDVAVHVAAQAVGHAGGEIGEHAAVPQAGRHPPRKPGYAPGRHARCRCRRCRAVLRPARNTCRSAARNRPRRLWRRRCAGSSAIDVARQFGLCLVAFIGAVDAVAGIGEPDRAVARHHDVVRRIQRFALVTVEQHGDAAVVLGAGDAAGVVLAGDQPAFAIAGVAVGVVRRARGTPTGGRPPPASASCGCSGCR